MNSNLLTELAARINEAYEAVASAQKGTFECAAPDWAPTGMVSGGGLWFSVQVDEGN